MLAAFTKHALLLTNMKIFLKKVHFGNWKTKNKFWRECVLNGCITFFYTWTLMIEHTIYFLTCCWCWGWPKAQHVSAIPHKVIEVITVIHWKCLKQCTLAFISSSHAFDNLKQQVKIKKPGVTKGFVLPLNKYGFSIYNTLWHNCRKHQQYTLRWKKLQKIVQLWNKPS